MSKFKNDIEIKMKKDPSIKQVQKVITHKGRATAYDEQKKYGCILRGDITARDFEISLAPTKSAEMKIMNCDDSDQDGAAFLLEAPEDLGEDSSPQEEEQIDITQLFLIDHRGAFSIFCQTVDTALCLLSSYTYMWFGAFNDSDNHDLHVTASVCFEVTFLVLMLKKFLTTFSNQGETKPVRNLH